MIDVPAVVLALLHPSGNRNRPLPGLDSTEQALDLVRWGFLPSKRDSRSFTDRGLQVCKARGRYRFRFVEGVGRPRFRRLRRVLFGVGNTRRDRRGVDFDASISVCKTELMRDYPERLVHGHHDVRYGG